MCCLYSCNVQGGWNIHAFCRVDSGDRVHCKYLTTCPSCRKTLCSSTCLNSFRCHHSSIGWCQKFRNSLHQSDCLLLPQIRDAYMLKIFEDNQARLPSWCNTESDKLPFCQILGEYRMELPEYNTIEPYAKMNENCPSLPPTYKRPARCWHCAPTTESRMLFESLSCK